MANRLSVVIDTYNKATDLPRCLESIKNIASEIIVCDEGSTDGTLEIAKRFKARIINHKKVDFVELIRNYEVGEASGDWILVLDPDEEVSPLLAKKILQIISQPQGDYYFIPRKNIIFGKWMRNSRWWPDMNLRLFKKNTVTWSNVIHEQPKAVGIGVNLDDNEDLAIIHHHYTTIDEYLERMGRYTTQQALYKLNSDHKFKWQDLISKPVSEFLSRYFFGKGYRDGVHGLVVAMLQSFSELVVYIKIWQNLGFEEKEVNVDQVIKLMKTHEKEIHYWQNDAIYNVTGNVFSRIKRKLRV